MIYLKAILLAVVEGLTEFLPISSTGHMIIVDSFMKLTDNKVFDDTFIVVIQFPAILSVVVYFWKTLWPFSGDIEHRNKTLVLWSKIAVAFIPTAILGKLLHHFIKARLFNPGVVMAALVVGGVVIILVERINLKTRVDTPYQATYGWAILMGLFQSLGMIPGTSRSAATIIGARLMGASRAVAAEFSFFLAIPTMLGATTLDLYEAYKGGLSFSGEQLGVLAVGSLVSFLVAYASIEFLMSYIRTRDFRVFGYYRIALGAVLLFLLIS